MKNGRIYIYTAKMESKTTNRAKMSNKRCIKARLQYLQRGYKPRVKRHHELPVLLYLSGFSG